MDGIAGYNTMKPAYLITLNKTQSAQLAMYSLVFLFLSAGLFEAVIGHKTNGISGLGSVAISILVYFGTLIIHEIIHGISFILFGGKPSYGTGFIGILPYFYTTTKNHRFTLRQMYVIGLSPFVLLSCIGLIGAYLLPQYTNYWAVAFISNFSGSVGDLWLMMQIARFHGFSDVKVEDLKNGIAVYSRNKDVQKLGKQLNDKKFSSFGIHFVWGSIAVAIIIMAVSLLGPIFQKQLLIGPETFPLVSYKISAKNVEFSLNIFAPIIGGFIFALFLKTINKK